MTQPVDVYRMFDSNRALLYVGKSVDWPRRFSGHAGKNWIGAVAFIEINRYQSEADAQAAEKNSIRSENPLYNVASKLGPQPLVALPRPKLELPPAMPDGYWIRNLIIVALTRMTDPANPGEWRPDVITSRVAKEIPKWRRSDFRWSDLTAELDRLATDPESPVQFRDEGISSFTRKPLRWYWITQ